MALKSLVVLVLLFANVDLSVGLDGDIKSFANLLKQPLNLANPILVLAQNAFSLTEQVSVFKSLKAENMGFISIIQLKYLLTESLESVSVIFIADAENDVKEALELIDNHNLGTRNDILLVADKKAPYDNIQSDIRINQNIYILDMESMTLQEFYKINSQEVWNTVGSYIFNNTSQGWSFQLNDSFWTRDVGNRRNNLHGQHLIGITINQTPYSIINETYKDEAPFFTNNGTYDVTSFLMGGLAYDVLDELAFNLNFTYSMYARNDTIWGDVQGNTSTGMVHNIAHGNADIGASMFGLLESRKAGLDFPPGIHIYTPSIFIQREQPEQLTWNMFLLPFSSDLWIIILLVAVSFASWLFLSNTKQSSKCDLGQAWQHIQSYFGWLWLTLSANFGGKPKDPLPKNTTSNRLIVFICLLAGTIVWIGFRSYLVSILSVVELKYPFNSLETMADTDFIVAGMQKGSAFTFLFTKATQGTAYAKVYQNNFKDELTYGTIQDGLKAVVTGERFAMIEDLQNVIGVAEKSGILCQLTPVWTTSSPAMLLTMPFKKGSPYFPTISYAIKSLKENGRIDIARKRHIRQMPNCSPLRKEAKALGIPKIFTIFLALLTGSMAGTVILLLELQWKPQKDKIATFNGLSKLLQKIQRNLKQVEQHAGEEIDGFQFTLGKLIRGINNFDIHMDRLQNTS